MESGKYILKNKNKNVLQFTIEIDEKFTEVTKEKIYTSKISKVDIIDKNNIPIDFPRNKPLEKALEEWISQRKAPVGRAHMERIWKELNLDDIKGFLDISCALSLNDTFWIKPSEKSLDWKKVSLYANSFDKQLALAAFNGRETIAATLSDYSPELSTNGALAKCWIKEKGTTKLLKWIDEYGNQGRENYAEYYMGQIAKALELNSINYDLRDFKGYVVSSCDLFTNEKEGYIPIGKCIDKKGILKNKEFVDRIAKVYGEESFKDLMVFDALIYNTDRHLGNFGMIIDNDTQKLLRPAPIFDNGVSFFDLLVESQGEYKGDIQRTLAPEKSWFGYTFDEQLELFSSPRHAKMYEKLANFHFERHVKFNLPDFMLEKGEEMIRERAARIVQIALNKDVSKSKPSVSVSPDGKISMSKEKADMLIAKMTNIKNRNLER